MKQKEEIFNIKFFQNLKKKFLQIRRSQATLDEYQVKKKIKINFKGKCKDHYKCSLCKDYFVQFVTTLCSHSFCKKCLVENLYNNYNCPNCKFIFTEETSIPTLIIDSELEIMLKDNQEYQKKLDNFKLWNQNRKIEMIQPNMRLDVLNNNYKWSVGQIIQIKYNKKAQASYITIHFENKSKEYDEMIKVDSNRLASFGTYSQNQNLVSQRIDQEGTNGDGQGQSRILFLNYLLLGRNRRLPGFYRIL